MSLVIYISQKTVIISKYGLEFGFVPPSSNLTKAAIGAYLLLRQSEILQTESTRSEKEEAITLLKHYGLALFQAIIPEHIKSQVYKAGGVFIYALEKEVIDLPWELLHDGSSFFALTQGVIRINQSESNPVPAVAQFTFPALRLSLNSYWPLLPQHTNARFIAHMEELAVRVVPRSPLVELQVNGNASRKSIIEALDRSPNVFFFSGFDSEDGWLLQEPLVEARQAGSLDMALRPHLMQAVKDGLKIVVLQTSYLLEQPKNSYRNTLRFFFDCGVSYIVAIHGRLAQSRLKEYFNIFLLGLIREENISRAHRLAINHIQASLPLSWDWSWIRFHINQKLLENVTEQPLPPFHFIRKPEEPLFPPTPLFQYKEYLPNRLFQGDPAELERFINLFETTDRHTVICLNAANGQPVEALLAEWVRRSIPTRSIGLSALYYQRWGFCSDTEIKLHSSKFAERFSFLTGETQIKTHFEQSQFTLADREEAESGFNVLFVYTPPSKPDLEFDRWLSQKQHDQWRIIFICDQVYGTSLKTHGFEPGKPQPLQIINSFEDGLPETWIGLVENNLPASMEELTLLKIIHKAENPDLIQSINATARLEQAYQTCFQFVLSALSANRLKLLVSLYLVRIPFPKTLLEAILEIKGIDADLKYLFDCHLIEASLSFEQFRISIDLQQRIQQLSLIPNHTILGRGQELLQQLIAFPNDDSHSLRYLESGFHYCILRLVQIGELEYPLQRNLQFGKKFSRKFQSEFRHGLNLLTSLELALRIGKGHLIQKTLFSLVETLEELPYENETIAICEWLLAIEKKHRNWPLVSEIQTRLASIFAAQDKKEKAIGLISSAIKLNNDIKNFSSRYRNLISIGLLLLDLEEFEKLTKLLTSANFDITLLNKEDVARLWLIDGHMLFHDGKFKEAETSFNKIIRQTALDVSDSLMAKTFLHLAEIYHAKSDWPLYVQYLENAVNYVQAIGDDEKAAQLHEELYELLVSQEDYLRAVNHLEWIYRFHQATGNKILIRKAADLLGGLYFKIGEHAKSTELYSVAQGI